MARVSFPVYAVSGRPAELSGWAGGVGAVDVDHDPDSGALEVTSIELAGEEHPYGRDPRERLILLLIDDDWADARSEAEVRALLTEAHRTAERAAADVRVEERGFTIDGAVEPFAFAAAGDAWAASREHYGVRVIVGARGVDPASVVLERLADPADLAAGTTAEAAPEVHARRQAVAGELLGREQVTELIDSCGLGRHRDAILGAVLAGYRLEPGGEGQTRIGGLPDMAEGEAWPHGPDGIPYTFVAQIDCSALRPLTGEFAGPEWRHDGALLRIFAALDARIPEPGPAIALACPPDAALTRAPLPPRPDPMPEGAWEPDDDSLRLLHETPMNAVPFLTAAVGWYVLPESARESAAEAYRELSARLAAGGAAPLDRSWGVPQLLGHAESVQGEDPRYAGPWLYEDEPDLEGRENWRVLLNIADGYRGMSFGDGGALAVVVPAADLAEGRYDRLVTEPSMG